ncbi:HAMP domain-containing histidine kinase [Algibacter amylolyticus]|uniref:histidine kinase n=1 Tax=Algibacter amylolyticus TaxID=1608400 RepID=A0A5M7AWT8_9FLAO|nr:HAMP domain-containing sensor histidine kinase [Algibacter amylolyticus]KAA5821883.1 HAMP domain-containing histidine kinase [Algibacter amylolyticus]MBB5269319.1 signal transduction histidine kinase [Algibacter amylolyticus]TSJ73167.1 HAMP domain-containing histidine kinase [Algibacter amylolyticus]
MSKETEEALKERIKELTCLYEISSIIEGAELESIENVLKAFAFSLKKAFLYPDATDILVGNGELVICTNALTEGRPKIESNIRVFNEAKGKIIASLNGANLTQDDFLKEEQQLLDNVALKVGNLLERIEIQKSEASLKRQMEHADRLSILGEITSGIAHELNTPLANILGFAELLKSDLEGDKKVASDLNKIIDNAIFSREVLKKLLFFSCKMPQEKKQVNLVPNIKSAINLLDATFRKENVKYAIKISEEELWLKADPIQLTQIIFNLLINAIYFSPKEGVVTIEAFQKKTNVILKISDEGKGLTPDDLEKIFQPFFTTKPMEDGSGLGLSVVHGIVASHKGSIVAGNNRDKGAVFTVTLPKM